MPVGSTPLLPPDAIAGSSARRTAAAAGMSPIPSVPSAPVSPVASRPLSPPKVNPQFAAPATASPRLATNTIKAREAARSIPTGTNRNLARIGNWTPEGGTPITVAQGESADMLARRYGVPAKTLLAVNGMKRSSDLKPGTRLVVPVYDASGKIRRTAAAKPAARKVASASPTVPRNLASPRQSEPRSVPVPTRRPKIVRDNNTSGKLRWSRGPRPAAEKAGRTVVQKSARKDRKNIRDVRKQPKIAAQEDRRKARLEARRKRAEARKAKELAAKKAAAAKAAEKSKNRRTASLANQEPRVSRETTQSVPRSDRPTFRWPARGRIIRAFRRGGNDGVNIAVPVGTAVKAADSGTVVYAGGELKGFGQLVLIKHANGYSTAYAHNGELKVKRGQTVRRGQVIARSGKTGNVSSPQLHFELRKGSTPVNPAKYLPGG